MHRKPKQKISRSAKNMIGVFCNLLEAIVSVMLVTGICIAIYSLFQEVCTLNRYALQNTAFTFFLTHALNLVIGIEFVKMLTKHTPAAVLEVLIFTIARQLIVAHGDGVQTLLGVLAIAVLFATRKFLFLHSFDGDNEIFGPTVEDILADALRTQSAEHDLDRCA